MERLGMTVQPGQAEQLKQFTQVPQLDRMLGLREGRFRVLQAIIFCLELVVESWRVESDLGPLTATLAKSSPYLRPTSAWRNDIFCNCRILFRWLCVGGEGEQGWVRDQSVPQHKCDYHDPGKMVNSKNHNDRESISQMNISRMRIVQPRARRASIKELKKLAPPT